MDWTRRPREIRARRRFGGTVALAAVALACSAVWALPARAAEILIQNDRGIPLADGYVEADQFCEPSGWCFNFAADAWGIAHLSIEAGWKLSIRRICMTTPPVKYTVPDPAPGDDDHLTFTLPSLIPAANQPAVTSNERWLIGKINQERARLGRGPLYISTVLSDAADRFAHWILTKNDSQLTHSGPPAYGGGFCTSAERGTDSGWPRNTGSHGENAALSLDNAYGAFEAWMDSPGHYENLTRASYGSVGVGHSGRIWVLDFFQPCTPAWPAHERCGMTTDTGDPTLPEPHGDAGGPDIGSGSGVVGDRWRLRFKKAKAKGRKVKIKLSLDEEVAGDVSVVGSRRKREKSLRVSRRQDSITAKAKLGRGRWRIEAQLDARDGWDDQSLCRQVKIKKTKAKRWRQRRTKSC